ncbi:uncharacterized protein A4U43_C04F9540 [Asparagus officinalis]|uniref:Proline dehydrogenase n=1 Tax=Asparagus officinalis TaxID=4686 RepID=A0A5P1EZK8_ASPOF|nr:uncharacterized protein A4U43_C04F9540 [Asparagus officinalis]
MAIASRLFANKTLALTRSLSTLTSNPITLTHKLTDVPSPDPTPIQPQLIDFNDTERIFSSISTKSLVRSLAILQTLSLEPLVDVGIKVMRSRVVQENRLARAGILDYGSEDAEDDVGCDRNLNGFLDMVEMTSSVPGSAVSSACVKITAICPISLLERVSDLLRWEKKDPSIDLPLAPQSLSDVKPTLPYTPG